jgi:hypothetical protein
MLTAYRVEVCSMSFAEPPPGMAGMTLRHETGCGALVVVGAGADVVGVTGWVVVGAGFVVVEDGAVVVEVLVESVDAVVVVGAEVSGEVVDGTSARFVFTETLVATSDDAPSPDVAVKYTATAAPMQSRAIPVRGPRARRMRSWLVFIVFTPSGAERNSPEGWPFGGIAPAQRVSAHEQHHHLRRPIHPGH